MRHDGFSLLEILISLVVLGALLGGLLVLGSQLHRVAGAFQVLAERDRSTRLSPVLLSYWISPEGANSFDRNRIVGEASSWEVRADIDGPDGFPDGRLADPYESLRLRSDGDSLKIRSGRGYFQPTLEGICLFRAAFDSPDLVAATIEGRTRTSPWSFPDRFQVGITLYLPNNQPSLFPKEVP